MVLWFSCEALNRHMDDQFYLYSSLLSIITLFLEGSRGKNYENQNKTTNQKHHIINIINTTQVNSSY